MFDGRGINDALAMNFLRGIACNQSIKRLHFEHCGEYLGKACRILTPLFKNNQVERIHIAGCELSHEGIRLLTASLTEFDSLKEFELTGARIQHNPQQAGKLMQSLNGHSGLRKLDLSSTNVGKLGCSALVDDLLSNPNINLRILNLGSNHLGDAEAVALSSGIAGNTTLKEINLSNNRGITEVGWQALFGTLSNSSCRLERLMLAQNWINDAAAQSLFNALTSKTTLKTLNLGYIRGITITGWRVLFDFLRNQTCALENLDLSDNSPNDEAMNALTDALASNRSLKSLNLGGNYGITATWQRFFSTVLANPSSELEKLDLRCCAINDAEIRALTDALVNNSKLKVLDLSHNFQITDTGWETFSSVLESPHTALEELELQGSHTDDDTATLLVNSLANNKKLKKLMIDHSDDWEPPLSVLCNTNSIMDTIGSNHALEKVGCNFSPLADEFESLLQINREKSPSQASRLKISKAHFKGGFITQPFVGMDLNVLPHAMAWMGRDGEVSNHFYGFIRSMASLFENAPDEEK